jgi:uncharacterized protein
MRLIDANLLVYAHNSDAPQHPRSRQWLEDLLNQSEPVGLPWPSLLAFVRLMTNPRIFARPLTVPAAWAYAESWLARPCAWIPVPTERHRPIVSGLLKGVGSANHVPDAHLAALAIEHGLILCTADEGFARYPNLNWENPLDGGTGNAGQETLR